MRNVNVLFVTPKHSGLSALMSRLVRYITGSKWSHVAIYLFDGIFEAIMPEVGLQPLDSYTDDSSEAMEVITIWLNDDDLSLIEAKAIELMRKDTKYGIRDCIAGGFSSVFGRQVGRRVARILHCGHTADCSQTVTILLCESPMTAVFLASMGVNAKYAELITPQDLYSALKAISVIQQRLYGRCASSEYSI